MEEDYYGEILAKTVAQKIPWVIQWELTGRCNLKCSHCYLVPDNERAELSTSEIKAVIDQLAEAGTLYLIFTGGELFLRADLFEIAGYARKKRFALRFFTNGTLITAQIADWLKEIQPLSVEISLYAAKCEIHEGITGIRGSYDKTISALHLLKERGVRTQIKFPVMKENLSEFPAVKKLAENLDFSFVYDLVIVPKDDGSSFPLAHRLTEEQMRGFLSGQKREIRERKEEFPEEETLLCNAGFNTACISPYGDLYPCVALKSISAGNLTQKPFAELWNSPEFVKLTLIKSADLYQCQKCTLKSSCFRCPGLALVEDGDLLGPSRMACTMAGLGR